MASVAAVRGSRSGRLRYVAERRGVLAALLISPAVLVIAGLVGVPLGLAVYLAFTDASGGALTGPWVGLRNFRVILHDPIFRGAIWHTIEMTVVSQAIVIVCAGLIAHALVRKFRGRWFLRFLILLPWAAPLSLTVVAFLWFFDPQGSIFNWFLVKAHIVGPFNKPNWLGSPSDAMASVITVQAWRTIPFATVIFLAGISSIPQEVDDAAAIDAATGLKKFWYVSLPLQLPIALVAVLFGIIFTATDMIVPFILTNGGPINSTETLTTYAYHQGIGATNVGQGAAGALFLLPVLALVAIGMLLFARRAEVT
jgi:multiple sugar transport system permease protein